MNIEALQSLVIESARKNVEVRRPHQFWLPYAWAVRVLIEDGMNASEATKAVLTNSGEPVTPQNLNCLRVVYYKIRDKEWPWGMKGKIEAFKEATVDVTEQEPTTEEPEATPVDVTEQEPAVIDEEPDSGYVPDDREFEV